MTKIESSKIEFSRQKSYLKIFFSIFHFFFDLRISIVQNRHEHVLLGNTDMLINHIFLLTVLGKTTYHQNKEYEEYVSEEVNRSP